MMLKKLSFTDLLKQVIVRVQDGTGLRCYDDIPLNAPAPFYFAEIVGLRPANTKTMYVDVFTVYIHAIAKASNSSIEIYKLIQELEEAMTKDIVLPCEYNLLLQTGQGLNTIKIDETNEKHAILSYEFKINYGFKIK